MDDALKLENTAVQTKLQEVYDTLATMADEEGSSLRTSEQNGCRFILHSHSLDTHDLLRLAAASPQGVAAATTLSLMLHLHDKENHRCQHRVEVAHAELRRITATSSEGYESTDCRELRLRLREWTSFGNALQLIRTEAHKLNSSQSQKCVGDMGFQTIDDKRAGGSVFRTATELDAFLLELLGLVTTPHLCGDTRP